jgi:transcription antitermination factor NusG
LTPRQKWAYNRDPADSTGQSGDQDVLTEAAASLCWIVATTQHMRERWAAQNAHAQGFDVYLPQLLQRRRAGKGKRPYILAAPLFPGYLFIRWQYNWHSLLSTYGVATILLKGESPDTIADKILRQIKARENKNGFVELPRPKPGMRALINKGAFQGQIGLYQGMQANDRKRVLLDILGRKTEVIVAADAVELAA